jgi:hypothetical protein
VQARSTGQLFDTVIRHSVRLREAAACGLPVQLLDPHGPAATNFDCLAAEVQALRLSGALPGVRPRMHAPSHERRTGSIALSQLQPTR